MSSSARDLISKLLVINPDERLGSHDIVEIKNHSFFGSIDWDTILTQPPPFIPKLEDPESTAYFQRTCITVKYISNQDTARETRFPINEDATAHMDDTPSDALENDMTFGGFWFVNFKNLESKNMDLLEDIDEFRKRTKSF